MRRIATFAVVLSVLGLATSFAESRGFGGGGGNRRMGKTGRASSQERELVARAVRRDNMRRARAGQSA